MSDERSRHPVRRLPGGLTLRAMVPNAITAAALGKILGVKVAAGATKQNRPRSTAGMLAPGMLPQHYSPHTPLVIKSGWTKLPAGVAGIYLRQPAKPSGRNVYWLSRRASLAEIARHLYQVLREADLGRHRQIWIEALPGESGGLAAAINDRLRRAAAKR